MTYSPIRYPGGKYKLLKPILNKLNSFNTQEYREPFFGGGSVGIQFLHEHPEIHEVWLNDLDRALIAFWKSIVDQPAELKQLVMEFKPSVDAFYEFKSLLQGNPEFPEDGMLEFGFKKFALNRISYSGLGTRAGTPIGGKHQKSKYKVDCRWSPQSICRKIDYLHDFFNQFNIRFSSVSFEELIKEPTNSLIYLDPPYVVKGNAQYECVFSVTNHEKLSELLRDTHHNWVLSYDDCLQVRELYSWAKIEILPTKYSLTMSQAEKDVAKKEKEQELLITA